MASSWEIPLPSRMACWPFWILSNTYRWYWISSTVLSSGRFRIICSTFFFRDFIINSIAQRTQNINRFRSWESYLSSDTDFTDFDGFRFVTKHALSVVEGARRTSKERQYEIPNLGQISVSLRNLRGKKRGRARCIVPFIHSRNTRM